MLHLKSTNRNARHVLEGHLFTACRTHLGSRRCACAQRSAWGRAEAAGRDQVLECDPRRDAGARGLCGLARWQGADRQL